MQVGQRSSIKAQRVGSTPTSGRSQHKQRGSHIRGCLHKAAHSSLLRPHASPLASPSSIARPGPLPLRPHQQPRPSTSTSGAGRGRASSCYAASNSSQLSSGGRPAPTSFHVPFGLQLSSYPSMAGRHILITGAARGLGLCTARLLAYLGGTLYLADVNTTALQEAVESIRRDVPGSQVTACPQLDLGSQACVHGFVDWWQAQGLPLHTLINNAGANFMGLQPWYTEQGVAGLPQVNYLGPYTLTRRVSSCLEASASSSGQASRIVNVCSVMHRFAALPEDPEFFLKDWWKGGSYRNCKLALTMTTALLQRQLGPRGVDCVSVDPGAVYSGIWSTSKILGRPPGSTVIKAVFSTPEDACATLFHAAATQSVVPGGYYARGLFADAVIVKAGYEPFAGLMSCLDWPLRSVSSGRLASETRAVEIAPYATQLAPAEALWDACADLAGLPRGI